MATRDELIVALDGRRMEELGGGTVLQISAERSAPNVSVTRQDHAEWRSTLGRVVSKGGVPIHVGAHGGQFTRLLAEMVPRGLVVAIEPSSYARSVLRTALWIRGVSNVIVVAAVMGSRILTCVRRKLQGRGLRNQSL
jgi:hypothetical protein